MKVVDQQTGEEIAPDAKKDGDSEE